MKFSFTNFVKVVLFSIAFFIINGCAYLIESQPPQKDYTDGYTLNGVYELVDNSLCIEKYEPSNYFLMGDYTSCNPSKAVAPGVPFRFRVTKLVRLFQLSPGWAQVPRFQIFGGTLDGEELRTYATSILKTDKDGDHYWAPDWSKIRYIGSWSR